MKFAQDIHIIPLLGPVEKSATFSTGFVSMKQYSHVEFLVLLGDLTVADFTMTVEASAVTAGSTPTALAFKYRVSAAAGTDTMGDITECPSTGLVLTNTAYDNKAIVIDINSDELPAGKPYVGLTFTDPGTADAFVGIVALLRPRYPQDSQINALA